MDLLDCFHHRDIPVIDRYTFDFAEHDPRTGYYMMLATSATGSAFSQWTEGYFEPGGNYLRLGERVDFQRLGNVFVEHVLERIQE
jgi:hypothetical protein